MAVATGKTLTARVRIDNKQALKALEELDKKINAINKKFNQQSTAVSQIDKNLSKTVTKVTKFNTEQNKALATSQKITKSYKETGNAVNSLTGKLTALVSAYLGVAGMRLTINTSDAITSAENKLNTLDGGTPVATQTAMDKMFAASQRARTGYTDMMTNVSKSITLASEAFGGNIDNAIRFQEIMAKAYSVGGASAAEQHSSMYQMIQALGSGVLQGDELRSVREGASIAYKEIEKFAQKLYETDESLKDLASDGKITSDIVVAAIMNAGDTIEYKFNDTSMTFTQAFQHIKNVAIKSFEPVLQTMNDVLNSDIGQKIVNSIGTAIQYVASFVNLTFQLLGSLFNWMSENWYWVQYIVYTGLMIIVTALGYLTGKAIIAGATLLGSMLAPLAPILLWIVAIGAVIAALVWLTGSIEGACGFIVSMIMIAVAIVWNAIVGVINAILQAIWSIFVEPIIGIVEFILNVFQGGFDSFGDGVRNLLDNIIGWFLSLGTVVTKIIDAIFGTDWTAGLTSLRDDILTANQNENAIVLDRSAPELQRWSYYDAGKTGYQWGETGATWVTDKLGDGMDWLKDKLNIKSLPNMGLDTTDLFNGVHNIDNNTDKISKSMELTAEDLEYLRKVAEMEWKKEFTTATIHVDMSNYNTVNGESDLDGIVTKLSEKLYEELQSVADGVYV